MKLPLPVMVMMFLLLTACSAQPDAMLESVFFPTQEPLTGEIILDDIWKMDKIPELWSNDWFEANHGEDIYIAAKNNVVVRTYEEYNRVYELKTGKGKIVGTNGGEWGGNIKFIPIFGSGYTLVAENFLGFYIIENRIFAFTGIAHMDTDEGSLYELIFNNGKWKAERIIDLESEPQSYLLVDKTLYLVTNKNLFIIENDKIAKQIVAGDSWFSLYPNSIVVINSTVYMGARGGMFSVDLDNETIGRYVIHN